MFQTEIDYLQCFYLFDFAMISKRLMKGILRFLNEYIHFIIIYYFYYIFLLDVFSTLQIGKSPPSYHATFVKNIFSYFAKFLDSFQLKRIYCI